MRESRSAARRPAAWASRSRFRGRDPRSSPSATWFTLRAVTKPVSAFTGCVFVCAQRRAGKFLNILKFRRNSGPRPDLAANSAARPGLPQTARPDPASRKQVMLGDAVRGIFFPTLWPLVASYGGTRASQGLIVAAFSMGRMVISPYYGPRPARRDGSRRCGPRRDRLDAEGIPATPRPSTRIVSTPPRPSTRIVSTSRLPATPRPSTRRGFRRRPSTRRGSRRRRGPRRGSSAPTRPLAQANTPRNTDTRARSYSPMF